jgi:ADP-heptose:LPS heptosyltransferase
VGFSPAFDIALPKSKVHVSDSAFRIPASLDPRLRISHFANPPSIPPRVDARVRKFLRDVVPGRRILAVHNETKPHKTWPPYRLSKLLDAFLNRHADFVVFVLDVYRPRWRLEKFSDRIIHSRGLPLPYAFSVLEKSDLFLGVDSCMLHAADLFRIPGVGLFGPTEAWQYGFRFAPHRHICDHRGVKHISEAAVLRALESLLT